MDGTVGFIFLTSLYYNAFYRFKHMLILPIESLKKESDLPLEPPHFEEIIGKICDESRRVLLKEWLPRCADILLKYKHTWRKFIPKKQGDALISMERFFGTINALLSKQLRMLVLHSINHFLQFLQNYKDGNDFGDEYTDLALIQTSILKIKVKPVVNTNLLELEPPLETMKDIVRNVFLKILDVNRKLPRFESIVFPEMANDEIYLHCVTEEDEVVAEMLKQGLEIIEANTVGPVNYLNIYNDYLYIMNGEASKELDEFFAIEPFPFLKDFAKRIERYQEIKRDIIFLRRLIPLNFVCLECDDLNDLLYSIVDDLRMRICNYFIEQNHNHNRG